MTTVRTAISGVMTLHHVAAAKGSAPPRRMPRTPANPSAVAPRKTY
jgi:hypothetical protein